MRKYLLVSKLALQDVLEYKIDFFLEVAKYTLMVVCMTLVWLAVEKDGHSGLLTKSQTVSYFICAAMIYSLSNFHPWYLEDDIRLGSLVRFLVKPVSTNLYYFFFQASQVLLETILKLAVFSVVLYYFHLVPDFFSFRFVIFLLYCPLIFIFSFQWLTLISLLSFWITETYAIRWAVTITTRFLSGLLVPLIYFPEVTKTVLFYLPFEHLAYTPIQFILGNMTTQTMAVSTLILLVWTILLSLFRQFIWKKGLLQFEGNGI